MALKLYHSKHARSLRIIWALEELGLEYSLETMDLVHGDIGGEAYRKITPLQKVPAMIVDGQRILESTAILEYLVTKTAPGQLALTAKDDNYARYLQWLHAGEAGLGGYMSQFLGHSMLLPAEQRVPAMAQWALGEIKNMFALFGEELSEDDFAAGKEFTIADISMGYMAFVGGFVKPVMSFVPPNVNKWWGRCQSRKGWNRAMKINLGKMQPGDK